MNSQNQFSKYSARTKFKKSDPLTRQIKIFTVYYVKQLRNYKPKVLAMLINLFLLFSFSSFTMKKKCCWENWIYSAIPTWWILLWMFIEISTQTRLCHKVKLLLFYVALVHIFIFTSCIALY